MEIPPPSPVNSDQANTTSRNTPSSSTSNTVPASGTPQPTQTTQPVQTTQQTQAAQQTQTTQQASANLSNISELQLSADRQYEARVLSVTRSDAQAGNLPNANQAVLQIGDRQVLAETQIPLRTGDVLNVRLINTPNGLALAISQNQPLPPSAVSGPNNFGNTNNTLSAALTYASTPSGITTATLESSSANLINNSNFNTFNTLLDGQNAQILTGIGRTLPNQIALQTGLNLLAQLSTNLSSNNGAGTVNAPTSNILSALTSNITQSELFQNYARQAFNQQLSAGAINQASNLSSNNLSSNSQSSLSQISASQTQTNRSTLSELSSLIAQISRTSSAPANTSSATANLGQNSPTADGTANSSNALNSSSALNNSSRQNAELNLFSNLLGAVTRQALNQSGHNFESSLQANPELVSNLSQRLDSLRNSIQSILNQPSGSSTNNTENSTLNNANIQNLLQGINSLLTTSSSSSDKLGQDLKQRLIELTTVLTQTNRAITQQTGTSSHIPEALNQADLSRNPLAFPNVSALFAQEQNLSRANATLSDQNLSVGQLLKIVASMLNRIHLTQLNNLLQNSGSTNEAGAAQSWLFELPIQQQNTGIHNFQVRIDQYKDQSPEQENPDSKDSKTEKTPEWRLSLAFDIPELGPIYIQASYVEARPTALNEHSPLNASIRTSVWCKEASTQTLIESEKKVFARALERIGLNVESIHCHLGEPPANNRTIDKGLVDVKA